MTAVVIIVLIGTVFFWGENCDKFLCFCCCLLPNMFWMHGFVNVALLITGFD